MRSTVSPDFARLGAEHSKQHYWLLGRLMMWTVLFGVTFSIAALLTICVIVSCYTLKLNEYPLGVALSGGYERPPIEI